MTNLKIIFANSPWLLLLLIPAIFLTLWPYFRLSKRYRRTRNRIVSIVLHLLIMVFSTVILSGAVLTYEQANLKNEVLLLVDASYSNKASEAEKNEFIQSVIEESKSKYQLGIVTFGYDQVYAVEFTNKTNEIYSEYIKAPRPNNTATDIASALLYAKDLFSIPRGSKIVLLTDGIQTDGDAMSAVMKLAEDGVRVDTVCFPDKYADDIQLVSITLPDTYVEVGEEIEITVATQSSFDGTGYITLYDNELPNTPVQINFKSGMETFTVKHAFAEEGLHEICFKIEAENGDTLTENNSFYTYFNLVVYDNILVLQKYDDAGTLAMFLRETYGNDYDLKVKVENIDNAPDTLNELREYDEVILMNIGNYDMPEGFDVILQSYVKDYGGGLLTVGGDKEDDVGAAVTNTYNRKELPGSLYQEMLPIQAVGYTPALALMIVMDRSGSMVTNRRMQGAKTGALATIDALADMDYCGIISFSSDYTVEIPMTPISRKRIIKEAVNGIEPQGETVYSQAIEKASQLLQVQQNVERRHIIFVTDGEPAETADTVENTSYYKYIDYYYKQAGITMSVVTINATPDGRNIGIKMAEAGHGKYYDVSDATLGDLGSKMSGDIRVSQVQERNEVVDGFTPTVGTVGNTNVLKGVDTKKIPALKGYYGVKLKTNAIAPLKGPMVPLYAQWDYGKGKVGSFMSPLDDGIWSNGFLTDASGTGKKLIENIIKALYPTKSIRWSGINVQVVPDNYRTQLNVTTQASDGQQVTAQITSPFSSNTTNISVTEDASGGFSKLEFVITQPGMYNIKIQRKDASGLVLEERDDIFTAFSYSAEYNVFIDENKRQLLITRLAENGRGMVLTDAGLAFREYKTEFEKAFDPRELFMILSIIFFLIDIAVRKFKFRWPHEMVRDYKTKKQLARAKSKNTSGAL